jgi:predicted O-methyltransferase YrrM
MYQPKKFLEIGVAYGYHAKKILRTFPEIEYLGVDPYIPNYDVNDPFSADVTNLFNKDPEEAFEKLYTAVKGNLKQLFGDRFQIIRMTSVDAAKQVEDESMDFIFIDGDHKYDSVAMDLKSWWPKLKVGGIMMGDDYDWPQVKQAVKEFFKFHNHEFLLLSANSTNHHSYFTKKVC